MLQSLQSQQPPPISPNKYIQPQSQISSNKNISKVESTDKIEKKLIKNLTNEELAAVVRSSFGSEDAATELLKKLNDEKLTAKILPTLNDADVNELKLKLGTKKALQELIKAAKENRTVDVKIKVISKEVQQPVKDSLSNGDFNYKIYDSDILCNNTKALDIISSTSSSSSTGVKKNLNV